MTTPSQPNRDRRKEELNTIFWNNFDIKGIEGGTFLHPVKATIQSQIENFIETEITQALAEQMKKHIEIVRMRTPGHLTRDYTQTDQMRDDIIASINEGKT